MPTTKLLPIKQLTLDLNNFRTVPQQNEVSAIHAMISINPDWFWALMDSLLSDGYHPTENIIVLNSGKGKNKLMVKEGNRRIGALKLIYGYISLDESVLPSYIHERIARITKDWKKANIEVPCAIYEAEEADFVDRLITLTHGKGDKAGRDIWTAVARARHNRDKSGVAEPGLDLLEKYLEDGKNVTTQQRERWSGDYPLTVLNEAIQKLATKLGVASSRELSDQYPGRIQHRTALESILSDIGTGVLGFKALRNDKEDFAQRYGIHMTPPSTGASSAQSEAKDSTKQASALIGKADTTATSRGVATGAKKTKAVSMDDPRAVMQALKKFTPRGNNREKLVTLLNEAKLLKLKQHPHAFCFLLRSMFEISAKAYCVDHAANGEPAHIKTDGDDRALVDILRDITTHLTKNKTDKQMKKTLHGAMAELGKGDSILSVTSMNQLVHNPRFSINESHISTVFGNVFPLLEEMNR